MQISPKTVLLALFLTAPLAVQAGDAKQEQNPAQAQQQDRNKTADKAAQQQDKEKAGNGHPVVKDFKPSEGISEDLSVSFPVDI